MRWMIMPLRRYFDFSGRSRRLEYWMFTLFMFIVAIAWAIVFFLLGDAAGEGIDATREMNGAETAWVVLGCLLYLAILIPVLAVQVRRFHDQDKTGWLCLLSFIPYIGGLIVLVFMVLPGTKGENRFGDDPKDPFGAEEAADVFS
ncbi:DUF805 domain-containing protein [Nostoc ellipsosporum NOK]|uniref:DUF805 domain-containing protein n=1 Tax=Sphingomonas sp. IBVSS2 TaxID=1985172 RepID=UPI000A2E0772|nr:DUF805 domain-containing protein [Sphingomonas sp. IBVSS2]MDF2385808.1 DUF805 domain-containing protein [Nostoc ellipsosporum NOK]OSZ68542.1 hypothetical protein CAP40_08180 [Sphingomonas sp. IBVSS2]